MVTVEERVMTLLARANPEPDEHFALESHESAYLATLEQMSKEMSQSGERRTRVDEQMQQRPGVLLVAAATVIVVLGLGFLTKGNDAASPRDLEVAETFLEAHVNGEAETALALMAPEATFGAEITNDPTQYSALLEWFTVTGHEWSIESCVADDASSQLIICPMQWGNAWSGALDSGPYPGEFRFTVEDGQVTGFFLSFGVSREYATVSEEVHAFQVGRYGDEHLEMYDGGLHIPKLTADSISLWEQMTSEFVEETSGRP